MNFFKNIDFKYDWKITVLSIAIIIGAFILTRIVKWLINKSVNTASEKLEIDPTRYKFFIHATSFIIWLIAIAAIISFIPKLKTLAFTLFAGAGILVAVIGFAAQAAFSNIISGIFIVIFKPFRVGDMIKVGTLEYGIVEDITLRHTIINNFENKRIMVPNSVIGSETIINDTIQDTKVCRWIEIGISYDSDVDLAMKIMQEEALKHPSCIDARTAEDLGRKEDQVKVRLVSFGDFSVNLRAYVWSLDPFQAAQMHSDINRAIKKRFETEGIEIPYPYRTLVYKNDMPSNSKPSK
jgi:small conductance mechanosensitive channel